LPAVWLPDKVVGIAKVSASPRPTGDWSQSRTFFPRLSLLVNIVSCFSLSWRLLEGALLCSMLLMSPSSNARSAAVISPLRVMPPLIVCFNVRVRQTSLRLLHGASCHPRVAEWRLEEGCVERGGGKALIGSLRPPWLFWPLLVVLPACRCLPSFSSMGCSLFSPSIGSFRTIKLVPKPLRNVV
jgi:hypothetical protein